MIILVHTLISIIFLAALTPLSVAGDTDAPITGCEVGYLQPIDAFMIGFVETRNIPGAILAISLDDKVVYERGFGWKDEELSVRMPPDALMRVASVSKPFTAAAIRELIDDGQISLDTKAFDLGQPGGGVLPIVPFPSLGDPRLAEITIQHLLDHRGGWDRDVAGDLTYLEILIAEAMGIPSPPGRENVMRYILGQPLQSTPGAEYHYSNIGFLTLGLIVEHVSGQPVLDFIHQRVLSPLGVNKNDHRAGRTFQVDHDLREPFYHSTPGAVNVFDPDGSHVDWAYGGWHHEARNGQGGQISTTRTLLSFLNDRYISGPSIGALLPDNLPSGFRRNHTGSLSGTEALARQRGDGISYAVLFNTRATTSPNHALAARLAIDDIFDTNQINWPTNPLDSCDNRYDLNNDGEFDFFDFSFMIQAYQLGCIDCESCSADLNDDCAIDFFDISILLRAYQKING